MTNQGARRATVAQLRRQIEALLTELTARESDLRQAREDKGLSWRSWLRQLPVAVTMLTAVGALFYTAVGLRQNQAATVEQNALTQSGQITDRFNAAVTNLGSENLTIRLGGIYALQRIMNDSTPDQPAVNQIITAFIRTETIAPTSATPGAATADSISLPADVQAALTVFADRNPFKDGVYGADLSLKNANLRNASLAGARLDWVDLEQTNLAGAILAGAHLAGANLDNANLTHAALNNADLSNTNFGDADLTGADLTGANLVDSYLNGVNFTGANLTLANLTSDGGGDLNGANFTNAYLEGATIPDMAPAQIDLINFHGADLGETWLCKGSAPIFADAGYVCKNSLVAPGLAPTPISSYQPAS